MDDNWGGKGGGARKAGWREGAGGRGPGPSPLSLVVSHWDSSATRKPETDFLSKLHYKWSRKDVVNCLIPTGS